MMTAMAILAPELRPPLPEPEPDPEALRAEGVGDVLESVVGSEIVGVGELGTSGESVDVTITTEGV